MQFIDQLTAEDRERCLRVLSAVGPIRTHRELLEWLQCSDMQALLPHDIAFVSWSATDALPTRFDVVSSLEQVRTQTTDAVCVLALAHQLMRQWALRQRPFCINADLLLRPLLVESHGKYSAWVHGLYDQRSGQSSCYVFVTRDDRPRPHMPEAIAGLLPHIDAGVRQVAMLELSSAPHGLSSAFSDPGVRPLPRVTGEPITVSSASQVTHATGMTEREQQIMRWVEMGKTNHEIGAILDISAYTVKNHLQRIFKKLDVYSRAQAVSRFKDSVLYG